MTTPSPMPEGPASALSSDSLIDAVCDEFEVAIRAGKQPALQDYLDRVAELDRPRLLAELVYTDFEFQPPPPGEDAQLHFARKYSEFAAEILQMSFVDAATDTAAYCRPASPSHARPDRKSVV